MPVSTQGSFRLFREAEWARLEPFAYLLCSALAVSCLWIVHYPPLVDLSQHALQLDALHRFAAKDQQAQQLYQLNWFTPYLFGYAICYFFTGFLSVLTALKLVLSLTLALTHWFTRCVFRALGVWQGWSWLALPATFSFGFKWGFVNFLVAIPLGLFFLLAVNQRLKSKRWWLGLCVSLLPIVMFFTHAYACFVFMLLGFAWIMTERNLNVKKAAYVLTIYLPLFPVAFAWFIFRENGEGVPESDWGSIFLRLLAIPFHFAGVESQIFGILLAIVILVTPKWAGAKVTKDNRRRALFATGVLLYGLMPSHLMGIAFVYQRLGFLLGLLYPILWEAPVSKKRVMKWLGVTVLIWASLNLYAFSLFDKEQKDFSAILEKTEPNKSMLGLMLDKNTPIFFNSVYVQFFAYYQVEKAGIVYPSFASRYPEIVHFKPESRPPFDDAFDWKQDTFNWEKQNGDQYDYILVRSEKDSANMLFKSASNKVNLIAQEGQWWLYAKNSKP